MIGIDEVGRGAWAGPLLVVAARATGTLPASLTDSKQLSAVQRYDLLDELMQACSFGEGWVSPEEIDSIGLGPSMRLAVQRALASLGAAYDDEVIMDGSVNYCDTKFVNVRCIVKADLKVPIVSAASVYAKVTRDAFMAGLHQRYACYQFDKHVGYGTPAHKRLLQEHGVSDIHRKSYKPIKALL